MVIEIAVVFIAVMVALGVGFLLPTILELRRTAAQATEFLSHTEKQLNSTLLEVEQALHSIRSITDNVSGVTSDVREFSDSITCAARDVRKTTRSIRHITRNSAGNLSAMRVAINTAIQVMLNNFRVRK